MRFVTLFSMVLLLSAVVSAGHAATPVAAPAAVGCNCQSCQACGCGPHGHANGCCCKAILNQAPPNPLAPGRPSPPPCCADGFAYPNYMTWGHYATRWRRWPIEIATTTTPTGVPTPRPLGPDVRPYVPLPPEEEDRRAPPPSAPRVEPGEAAPATPPQEDGEQAAPPQRPAAPGAGTDTAPSPESIFGAPPAGETPTPGLPLGEPADETPTTTPLTPPPGTESTPNSLPLPMGEPTGDYDAPPAPPFAVPTLKVPVRTAVQPAPAAAPKQNGPAPPQEDPPPALPPALASLAG